MWARTHFSLLLRLITNHDFIRSPQGSLLFPAYVARYVTSGLFENHYIATFSLWIPQTKDTSRRPFFCRLRICIALVHLSSLLLHNSWKTTIFLLMIEFFRFVNARECRWVPSPSAKLHTTEKGGENDISSTQCSHFVPPILDRFDQFYHEVCAIDN